MYKLNASKNNQAKNEALLKRLALKGWNVDRFGHATKQVQDRLYRYKFQSHSVRYEVQVIHAASGYAERSTSWVRLNTHRYSEMKDS